MANVFALPALDVHWGSVVLPGTLYELTGLLVFFGPVILS